MTARTLVTVRPRRSLLSTAFFSILLVMIPVFGVLYWFADDGHGLALVAVINALVIALATAILLRQLTVHTAVTETELRGSGIFSPLVSVPLDRIASVHLVETYVGQATEPTTQFVAADSDGTCLYRNRGNFWHDGDLRKVAEAIPVPLTVVTEPLTMQEFSQRFPGSAYWFERRPVLRLAAIAGVGSVAIGATAWMATVIQGAL